MRVLVSVLVALFAAGVSLGHPEPEPSGLLSRQSTGEGADEDCVSVSLVTPRWSIYELGFLVYNYSTGGTTGDFRFRSYNFATNVTTDCVADGVDMTSLDRGGDNAPWRGCSVPGLEYKFNMTTFLLSVKETWTCPSSPR
jgi:hypothetical protein